MVKNHPFNLFSTTASWHEVLSRPSRLVLVLHSFHGSVPACSPCFQERILSRIHRSGFSVVPLSSPVLTAHDDLRTDCQPPYSAVLKHNTTSCSIAFMDQVNNEFHFMECFKIRYLRWYPAATRVSNDLSWGMLLRRKGQPLTEKICFCLFLEGCFKHSCRVAPIPFA